MRDTVCFCCLQRTAPVHSSLAGMRWKRPQTGKTWTCRKSGRLHATRETLLGLTWPHVDPQSQWAGNGRVARAVGWAGREFAADRMYTAVVLFTMRVRAIFQIVLFVRVLPIGCMVLSVWKIRWATLVVRGRDGLQVKNYEDKIWFNIRTWQCIIL